MSKINVPEYLSNFYKGTKKQTLEAMEYLMEEFDHPEKHLKTIHIAGTNGKGSCAEMMTNILIKAGYKVGKFIGPHLEKYNERISIGNKNITDEEAEKLIKKIEPKMNKYNNLKNSKITLFELYTIMAILYFYENNCDFIVIETGLGGLYDSTNIVNPIASIITSVGYDHMHILGNTLEEIAEQKAGIIKENSETIFIEQEEIGVNNKIKQICLEKNNILHLVQKEKILNYSYTEHFQKFDYKKHKDILINLKGEKQIFNASICIECTEILKSKSYEISEQALRDGLKTVIHKARFETISNNPLVIYDGGHNRPAIKNLINSINMYYKNEEKVFIISILKTKDYDEILRQLLKDEKSIFIFTSGNNKKRYAPKEELLENARKYTNNKRLFAKELKEAIYLVKETYKNHVTFVVGSLYTYGTVIKYLTNKN